MERSNRNRWLAFTGAVVLVAGAVWPARAQDADDLKRGVARISLMNGEVSVRRGDSGDWVAGVINAPLLTDDRVSTAPNSRAEVQFDSANILRIGGNAEVRLTQLEYGRYQMELARGTITYRVFNASSANVEVDTPSVSVRPSKQGTYRISVNDVGETQIMARAGDVEVFTPKGSERVQAGQELVARGTAADPEFQTVTAIPPDDWDGWNENRDRSLTSSTSSQYVPPGVTGSEDLDQYGNWTNVAPYGNVWRPAVAPGWAPYQAGSWVWEDYYGWTWVSADPWGWAPYHYGRWFYDAGWCWYPGVSGVRHYWSPGLVAFFGFGGGGGIGFGFGNIGWVPLAPYEVFHPWWGRGYYGGFNRGINITNVNITNIYRNARVGNGVSAVGTADFQSGRFNRISRVSGDQVRQAGLVRGQMPVGPTSANLRFSQRQASFVPRTNENTRFFTHQQPSAAARVPFAQQQRSFEQGGRVNEGHTTAGPGSQGPASSQRDARQTPSAQQSQGQSGWRRYSEPAGQNPAPRRLQQSPAAQSVRPPEAPAQRGGSGGWQRFGEPGNPGGSTAPRQQSSPAPRSEFRGVADSGGGYGAPRTNMAPPVVRERSSAPNYSAPRSNSGGGGFGSPRSSGGGGSSAPRSSGGGHSSGGGGNSRGGGHR